MSNPIPSQPSPAAGKPPRPPPPPCAVCSYLCRRCSRRCVMAPYFPAQYPERFETLSTHFDVDYVVECVETLPPDCRREAVVNMFYEAYQRARDPAGGCYAVFRKLRADLQSRIAELLIVTEEIAFQRSRFIDFKKKIDDRIDDEEPDSSIPSLQQFL